MHDTFETEAACMERTKSQNVSKALLLFKTQLCISTIL